MVNKGFMEQSYVINELYLKDISLQTTWSSLCPDDIHQNVHIDVSSNLIDNDDVKLCVELKVIITKSHNNEDLLKLEVTYATVVSNIDTNASYDELDHLMSVKVLQPMYTALCQMVSVVSQSTPYGIISLDYFDFEKKQYSVPAPETFVDIPLGYEWIIKDVESTDAGLSFLQSYRSFLKDELKNYHALPVYKYYYRFFEPIEYKHPNHSNCDDYFWDLLLQLIFAEADDPKIVENENEDPDIMFSFNDFHQRVLSELSDDELKKLTSDLSTQSFTDTGTDLLKFNFDDSYSASLNNHSPLKEELLYLYKCSVDENEQFRIDFVNNIYDRIKNYNLQTLPFHIF